MTNFKNFKLFWTTVFIEIENNSKLKKMHTLKLGVTLKLDEN